MRKDTPEYVKELSKELRKAQTEAETKLWQKIRGNRLAGYKFRRQYSLGRYIADFYCSKVRLAIEIDGRIHEEQERREYDIIREDEITARGVKVIRFANEQVINDINSVLDTIYKELTKLSFSKA